MFNSIFRRIAQICFVFLVCVGFFAVIGHMVGLDASNYEGGPPGVEWFTEQMVLYRENGLLTYTHLLSAIVFVVIAPFQFMSSFRNKYIRWHRVFGRIFIGTSVIASTSGLILGIKMPYGGLIQTYITILVFIMVTTAAFVGIRHIKNKRMLLHQAWMVRLFAWSMSIATMRFVVGAFYNLQPWDNRTWFAYALGISLIINILFAELWIKRFLPLKKLRV